MDIQGYIDAALSPQMCGLYVPMILMLAVFLAGVALAACLPERKS